MTSSWSDWILRGVFVISLVLVGYDMVTNTRPSQELLIIQLLGLGCGLIVLMRNRRNKQ
jgi:hypothetical protein